MKNKNSIYTEKSQAGKGDRPRSISKKYWENFDIINWKEAKKNKKEKNIK